MSDEQPSTSTVATREFKSRPRESERTTSTGRRQTSVSRSAVAVCRYSPSIIASSPRRSARRSSRTMRAVPSGRYWVSFTSPLRIVNSVAALSPAP